MSKCEQGEKTTAMTLEKQLLLSINLRMVRRVISKQFEVCYSAVRKITHKGKHLWIKLKTLPVFLGVDVQANSLQGQIVQF